MVLENDRVVIPDQFMEDIACGKLWRDNGVLRDDSGRIKTHLPVVKVKDKCFKVDKRVAAAAGIAGLVVVGGVLVYKIYKSSSLKKLSTEFNNSLSAYIEAANKGSLSIEEVKNLRASFEKVKKKKVDSFVRLDSLWEYMNKFTRVVAKENNYMINEEIINIKGKSIDGLIYFTSVQEKILKSAA